MPAPTVYLDPFNHAFVDAAAAFGPFGILIVEQFRAAVKQIQQYEPIPGVTRTDFPVPFEDGVKALIFKPKGCTGNLPGVFYVHGGAWVAGRPVVLANPHDSLCRDIALQDGCAVMHPEHALAPEARYSTQQEQCYAAVKWVREQGNNQGLSQELLAIIGDSAGGQLDIAVVILASTRKPTIPISYQVLISPVADTVTTDRSAESEYQFINDPFLTVPFVRKAIDEYIPNTDRTSQFASSHNIPPEDAKKQPYTLILDAAIDILSGFLYGRILQKAGVDMAILTSHGRLHDSVVYEATRTGATLRAEVGFLTVSIKDLLVGKERGMSKRDRQGSNEIAEKNGEEPIEEERDEKMIQHDNSIDDTTNIKISRKVIAL